MVTHWIFLEAQEICVSSKEVPSLTEGDLGATNSLRTW